MEILDLKSLNFTLAVSTSSMRIVPSIGESLKRAEIKLDLPAPVLPTIPTYKNKNVFTLMLVFPITFY